ncbi:MAG: hypothetical protein JKY37_22600 [Nannocystaceae bacterium]|nr:hypothetical protein [Nannocystaceae bacterium]
MTLSRKFCVSSAVFGLALLTACNGGGADKTATSLPPDEGNNEGKNTPPQQTGIKVVAKTRGEKVKRVVSLVLPDGGTAKIAIPESSLASRVGPCFAVLDYKFPEEKSDLRAMAKSIKILNLSPIRFQVVSPPGVETRPPGASMGAVIPSTAGAGGEIAVNRRNEDMSEVFPNTIEVELLSVGDKLCSNRTACPEFTPSGGLLMCYERGDPKGCAEACADCLNTGCPDAEDGCDPETLAVCSVSALVKNGVRDASRCQCRLDSLGFKLGSP